MSTGVILSVSRSGLPVCCRYSAGHNKPVWMAFNLVVYYRNVDDRQLPIFSRPGKNAFQVISREVQAGSLE